LEELANELEQQKAEIGFGVSVLGTGGTDAASFAKGVIQDASNFAVFSNRCEDICGIEAYEVKAPYMEMKAALRALGPFRELDVFVEVPWDDNLHDNLHLIAESDWLGAKARTGGVEPSAFPPSERLATFLQECLNLNVSFKLTAGLHHAIRHLDPGLNVTMHGFLNVLVAAALADEQELSRREIMKILDETDPSSFQFNQDSVIWRGMEAGLDGVEDMRGLFIGFGSCSVQEPVNDLRALNLLDEVKG
jgi:hypothetical protein